MSVWFCIPSARKPAEVMPVLHKWIDLGYQVIVQRDPGASISVANIQRPYAGYAEAVNFLIQELALKDPSCEWIVTGGDDIWPDPSKTASEIAHECGEHFEGLWCSKSSDEISYAEAVESRWRARTFGVMQPTGDRWGESADQHSFKPRPTQPAVCICGRGEECDQHLAGAYIDRVAGSPWIGREFARRMYAGRGPLWPEYFHMGEDEELQAVAIQQGVFWQRPDLTHYHAHWGRPKPGKKLGNLEDMPAFLTQANSRANWLRYKEIFGRRKAAGFPGSEPIK